MIESTKACRRCGEVKPLSAYYKHAAGRVGHDATCKTCRLAERKAHYESIRERRAEDRKTERCRASLARWLAGEKGKDYHRARGKIARDTLSDKYVKDLLTKQSRLTAAQLPQELIEMKRLQIETLRLARQLKENARESSKNTD